MTVKSCNKQRVVKALGIYKKYHITTVVLSDKIIPKNYFKGMKSIKKIYFKKAIKKLYKQSFKGMNKKAVIYVKKRDYKQSKKMIRKINRKVKVRAVA